MMQECCVHKKDKNFLKNKLLVVVSLVSLLLVLSLFIPALVLFRNNLLNYAQNIWWAVILGLLLGGAIEYYILREYISKILSRKSPATIFKAVFLGFLMSACSHGILALSVQLHKKGASNPAVVSFLLASPWANFTLTVMLVGFFGLKGILIILCAIVVAVNTGIIFLYLEKKGLIEKNDNSIEVGDDFSVVQDWLSRVRNYKFTFDNIAKDLKGVTSGGITLSNMVLWWIILGMSVASLAGAYIPTHFFHRFMGPDLFGLIVTLGLATVIEVCSEGSSPLAFEIYRQTGALGNSFTFLMAGVATDYTEIGLLWQNVGRRVSLWLPIVCVPQVLVLGYAINFLGR